MPELRDVFGESERLQKRREAVLESSKALDRLTRELSTDGAEESADPSPVVDEALGKLANPESRA